MKGFKLLIIALCIFKVIYAAPAAQSSTTTILSTTTTPQLSATNTTQSSDTNTPQSSTTIISTTTITPQSSATNTPQSSTTVPQSQPDPNIPISTNGTCGESLGTRCPDGTCCSAAGRCGETPEHCQAGCQAKFGTCGLPDSVRNKGFQFNTCTENNTIAITFDDGPRNVTDTLLDNLKERGVKATFFMNGHAFEEHCIYDYASVVKRAFKEGHQIAAHTWSHPHLPQLSEEEVRYQIDTLEVAFKKILGVVPTYFRPPFGERNELVQTVLREKGYKMIIWDIDTNDFKEDLQLSMDLYNGAINNSSQPNPHIILNHDRVEMTSTTLAPYEVDDTLKRGYKVTTVGDCIGKPDKDDWYRHVGEPEEPNDTWKCTLDDMHIDNPQV